MPRQITDLPEMNPNDISNDDLLVIRDKDQKTDKKLPVSSVVRTSGDQSIAGAKTFTGTVELPANSITPNNMDKSSFILADENGWKRYINPVNGKIRYQRSGTVTGVSGGAGGFQYITTGINFPSSVRVISASVGARDQAVSITPVLNVTNVRFVAQTFYTTVTPVVDWYYELEQL